MDKRRPEPGRNHLLTGVRTHAPSQVGPKSSTKDSWGYLNNLKINNQGEYDTIMDAYHLNPGNSRASIRGMAPSCRLVVYSIFDQIQLRDFDCAFRDEVAVLSRRSLKQIEALNIRPPSRMETVERALRKHAHVRFHDASSFERMLRCLIKEAVESHTDDAVITKAVSSMRTAAVDYLYAKAGGYSLEYKTEQRIGFDHSIRELVNCGRLTGAYDPNQKGR